VTVVISVYVGNSTLTEQSCKGEILTKCRHKCVLNPQDHLFVSGDLQKVIMLPRLDQFKTILLTRRIITFVRVLCHWGKIQLMHRWQSSGMEDVTSAFHAFLRDKRDCKYITARLDNCSGQNKNWCLYSSLTHIVNCNEISANIVELKYFEAGHTFML